MSMIQLLSGSAKPAPVFSDNLVYADNAAAVTAGYSNTGSTITFNYTTAPAPLGGYISSVNATGTGTTTCPVFTYSGDELWVYFLCNQPTNGGDQIILNLRDSSNTAVGATLTVLTDGRLRITSGSTETTGGSVWSTSTTYEVLVRYRPGNGSTAIIQVWLSTNGTWGSPVVSKTDGTATATAQRVRFQGGTSANAVFNKLRAFNSFPGNNVQ